jgi:EpsI family protein
VSLANSTSFGNGFGSRRVPVAVILAAFLMIAGAVASVVMMPSRVIADEKPPINLETLIPASFAGWKIDPSVTPVLPDPTVQTKLDQLYSQTLNRTYVNEAGQRVMLSIAYGRNQNSESTAAHRPEFCYVSQGFAIHAFGQQTMKLSSHAIQAVRLQAMAGGRVEPISYWITLNDEASVPGFDRKLRQLRYGLQGLIVDGMLVRVSSLVDSHTPVDTLPDYSLHDRFVGELEAAVPTAFRARIFGS